MEVFMNKLIKKIKNGVVGGYNKIEKGVVSTYNKIENRLVSRYKKIESKFAETFLTGIQSDFVAE